MLNLITQEYRKADINWVNQLNKEAKSISQQLKLESRVEVIGKQEAFLTVKDHKQDFPNKIECRLINPCKTQIGRIFEQIIDRWRKDLKN